VDETIVNDGTLDELRRKCEGLRVRLETNER
jgi:hypothetical protein